MLIPGLWSKEAEVFYVNLLPAMTPWHIWEISMACKEQQLKVLKNQREACQKLILAAQCSGLEE